MSQQICLYHRDRYKHLNGVLLSTKQYLLNFLMCHLLLLLYKYVPYKKSPRLINSKTRKTHSHEPSRIGILHLLQVWDGQMSWKHLLAKLLFFDRDYWIPVLLISYPKREYYVLLLWKENKPYIWWWFLILIIIYIHLNIHPISFTWLLFVYHNDDYIIRVVFKGLLGAMPTIL